MRLWVRNQSTVQYAIGRPDIRSFIYVCIHIVCGEAVVGELFFIVTSCMQAMDLLWGQKCNYSFVGHTYVYVR